MRLVYIACMLACLSAEVTQPAPASVPPILIAVTPIPVVHNPSALTPATPPPNAPSDEGINTPDNEGTMTCTMIYPHLVYDACISRWTYDIIF